MKITHALVLSAATVTRAIHYTILVSILLLAFMTGAVPGKVHAAASPGDVYAVFELADRSMDAILRARRISQPDRTIVHERGLKPMHVYQMAVSCVELMHYYELGEQMIPVPIVVATPRVYTPADVLRLAELIRHEIGRIGSHLGVSGLPGRKERFTGKTPNDVYSVVALIYMKVSLLSGQNKISPDTVFAQMVRAISDVKSILGHIDPALRYRIDYPESASGLKPTDVFRECISARKSINDTMRHFGLEAIPVPEIDPGMTADPVDVFLQTQIIIAEITLLKMGTGTVSTTPLPIPVTGKTPSHVYQQAVEMKYLLGQIKDLGALVKKMRAK